MRLLLSVRINFGPRVHVVPSCCELLLDTTACTQISQSSSLVLVPPQFQCSAIVKRSLALEEIRKERLVQI